MKKNTVASFLISLFLNFSAHSFEVHLDVGKWDFKEKYGLFKIKEKVVKKCRKPRSSFGVITYLDCPFVLIQSENNIRVYRNPLVEDLFEETDYKIILKFSKEETESFYGIGTQFTHFRLNGKKFEILSQEQGKWQREATSYFLSRGSTTWIIRK